MAAMLGRALPPLPGEELPLTAMDFLMPTGVVIPMQVSPRATLRKIKEDLYLEAKKYPLFTLLKDQGFYNFLGISSDGDREEFVNDSETLESLCLAIPLLKLMERQGNQEEKLLNAEISNLIGKRLHDFDVMGAEVQDFRRNILNVCELAIHERTTSAMAMVKYSYPPNLVSSDANLPPAIVQCRNILLDVCYVSSDGKVHQAQVNANVESFPRLVLEQALHSSELRHLLGRFRPDSLVLKVVGREEYLLEDTSIIRYKYITQCVVKGVRPRLSLKPFEDLVPSTKEVFIRPVHASSAPPSDLKPGQTGTLARATAGRDHTQFIPIWEVKETYRVKVLSTKNTNVAENHKVYVRAGIYHGTEPLCRTVTTSRGAPAENAEWNEILEFDIPVQDLPRSSKLCFVILGATDAAMKKGGRTRKQTKDIAPVAWVNMSVFDYASKLQLGHVILHAWPMTSELEEAVKFMGPTVLNSSTAECVTLEIDIPTPATSVSVAQGKPIMYPSYEQIRAFASEMAQGATSHEKFPTDVVDALKRVLDQDPLAQLDEQDKELIWRMRYVCMKRFPHSLPKLLQSISWNNRSDVAQVYVFLQKWQRLAPETAMELLDYQYADITVRNWAVECLEVLSEEKLLMYLLQLVQVLKFESYLDCALGQFLLRRGLRSKTVGHFLFWHLRAEMHVPTVSVRFGLMLEAYCRGCGDYRKELSVQLGALTKMEQVTNMLQSMSKKKTDELLKCLKEPHFLSVMENISSPLDPSLSCKSLLADKCKVMDSKMRPLWLVFQNQDTLGDNILQIFKNGDDLRQDMLTLQIMSIMDSQWKQAGLDLRMNPYACLSTGNQVGMIEVVLTSSTIAKIQKKKGARGAFDKKLLLQWLKEKNQDPGSLEKAIENFTYSCAGSCVATYVLGIGDRHSDNIMLKENGQLVHIDFGHFLGNFKSKFGVKRERVPFVLTDDFIYIITKGGDKTSREFGVFKTLCEEAFLKLRDRGVLFIDLFTMMVSCGIPELQGTDDISYIREALCLGQSKEVALDNFRKKMQESLKNSWSVSLNWYFHNVARTGN